MYHTDEMNQKKNKKYFNDLFHITNLIFYVTMIASLFFFFSLLFLFNKLRINYTDLCLMDAWFLIYEIFKWEFLKKLNINYKNFRFMFILFIIKVQRVRFVYILFFFVLCIDQRLQSNQKILLIILKWCACL